MIIASPLLLTYVFREPTTGEWSRRVQVTIDRPTRFASPVGASNVLEVIEKLRDEYSADTVAARLSPGDARRVGDAAPTQCTCGARLATGGPSYSRTSAHIRVDDAARLVEFKQYFSYFCAARECDDASLEADSRVWRDHKRTESARAQPDGGGGTPVDFVSRCQHCGRLDKKMLKCGACLQLRYCDRVCQRADWARHAPLCREHVARCRAAIAIKNTN